MHTNGVNGAESKSVTNGSAPSSHPFDPLTPPEIEAAVELVRKEHGNLFFNIVTLQEPRKAEMMAWLKDAEKSPRPPRAADVVALGKDGQVYEGIVDLDKKSIAHWTFVKEEQPLVEPATLPQ